ncbi:hypothetical protein E4T56_gene13398 [Termitomyces sp. T112]|nr:hypothetical protein E4T56_gene13398 [Termitomyces sp. T112]
MNVSRLFLLNLLLVISVALHIPGQIASPCACNVPVNSFLESRPARTTSSAPPKPRRSISAALRYAVSLGPSATSSQSVSTTKDTGADSTCLTMTAPSVPTPILIASSVTATKFDPLAISAIIIGSIAGVLLILAIIFIVSIVWKRRRQQNDRLIARPFLQRMRTLSAILEMSIRESGTARMDRTPSNSRLARDAPAAESNIVNQEDVELPESQQNTIVNPEPDNPAEMLRQENERLRQENELLRLMASGSPQPVQTHRLRH